MDSKLAVEWVNKNKWIILDFTSRFKIFTPYSDEDFISAAYQAALVTEKYIKGTNKPFCVYFWPIYETVLATFVPNPFTDEKNKHQNWSRSIPSNLCDYPEDITSVPYETELPALGAYTEEVYKKIRRFLKPRHQRLLRLLLGLNRKKGCLSQVKAANVTGYTQQNVSKFLNNLCNKIQKLIADGKLDFTNLKKVTIDYPSLKKEKDQM